MFVYMCEQQDNTLSVGGRVKEDASVIKTLSENYDNVPNVRCRIENFGNVVSGFGVQKRTWVEQMGFKSLLSLAGKGLPRTLCYWLATRVDVKSRELLTVDGKEFSLEPVHVSWVLGIPCEGKTVPNKILNDQMREDEKQIWQKFGTHYGQTCGLVGSDIEAVVIQEEVDELEFKRAFLMYALNEVLCPTTCHRLSVKLVPAATLFREASEYDWCSLVLDHLMYYLLKFAKTFHAQGYAPGCGGCTMFLAVSLHYFFLSSSIQVSGF